MRVEPFFIRPPRETDLVYLAERLRPADLAEVRGMIGGSSVLEALRASVALSPICGTALIHGEPVFIIGAAEGDQGEGQPWLLATERVERYPKAMTAITKRYIVAFMERWPALLNYVDRRNLASIRWLQRLGFQIHEPLVMGVAGEHFHPFTMGAWPCASR